MRKQLAAWFSRYLLPQWDGVGPPVTGMGQAARIDSVTPCVTTCYDAASGWIETRKKRLFLLGVDH
jgi:hypothetical protein